MTSSVKCGVAGSSGSVCAAAIEATQPNRTLIGSVFLDLMDHHASALLPGSALFGTPRLTTPTNAQLA
jgi:hypothetical protein